MWFRRKCTCPYFAHHYHRTCLHLLQVMLPADIISDGTELKFNFISIASNHNNSCLKALSHYFHPSIIGLLLNIFSSVALWDCWHFISLLFQHQFMLWHLLISPLFIPWEYQIQTGILQNKKSTNLSNTEEWTLNGSARTVALKVNLTEHNHRLIQCVCLHF